MEETLYTEALLMEQGFCLFGSVKLLCVLKLFVETVLIGLQYPWIGSDNE